MSEILMNLAPVRSRDNAQPISDFGHSFILRLSVNPIPIVNFPYLSCESCRSSHEPCLRTETTSSLSCTSWEPTLSRVSESVLWSWASLGRSSLSTLSTFTQCDGPSLTTSSDVCSAKRKQKLNTKVLYTKFIVIL